jgi:large subunit ribosomal protein L21
MYAIIDVGGKQFKVEKGKTIKIDLPREKKIGDTIEFKTVFISGDDKKLQTSPSTKVVGKVVDRIKDKKVVVFKKKPKKGYKKTIGHRQEYAEVEIVSVAN